MTELNEVKSETGSERKIEAKTEIEAKIEIKKESMLSTSINILKEEENQKNFFRSVAIFLVAYSFLYGFWKIPIIDFGINRTSAIGLFDYLFVIAVAVLTSIFLSLFLYERRNKLASASSLASESSIGGVAGGFPAAEDPDRDRAGRQGKHGGAGHPGGLAGGDRRRAGRAGAQAGAR